jgi:hypothetical protein
MKLTDERENQLTIYAQSLSAVEGAEVLPSIVHKLCNTESEISAVYYCLTIVMDKHKNAYCYALSTTTKKSRHEQKMKFTKYMETLTPQDKEIELYSLSPLIPNGSNIQKIKDRFRTEVDSVLKAQGIGVKRRDKLIPNLIKELQNFDTLSSVSDEEIKETEEFIKKLSMN